MIGNTRNVTEEWEEGHKVYRHLFKDNEEDRD